MKVFSSDKYPDKVPSVEIPPDIKEFQLTGNTNACDLMNGIEVPETEFHSKPELLAAIHGAAMVKLPYKVIIPHGYDPNSRKFAQLHGKGYETIKIVDQHGSTLICPPSEKHCFSNFLFPKMEMSDLLYPSAWAITLTELIVKSLDEKLEKIKAVVNS